MKIKKRGKNVSITIEKADEDSSFWLLNEHNGEVNVFGPDDAEPPPVESWCMGSEEHAFKMQCFWEAERLVLGEPMLALPENKLGDKLLERCIEVARLIESGLLDEWQDRAKENLPEALESPADELTEEVLSMIGAERLLAVKKGHTPALDQELELGDLAECAWQITSHHDFKVFRRSDRLAEIANHVLQKHRDPIRRLVIAGQFLVAEIERRLRADYPRSDTALPSGILIDEIEQAARETKTAPAENQRVWIPIGTTDRNGVPLYVGDSLRFGAREWFGGDYDKQTDPLFTLSLRDGELYQKLGTPADLRVHCYRVRNPGLVIRKRP